MTEVTLNENEFLALKICQPFNEFYSVRIDSEFLLERSYSKAADFDGSDFSGAQRKITNQRLNEISDFIDSDEATFPNSIIVAANYDEHDVLVEDDFKWRVEEIDSALGLYKLIVPSNRKVCSVVDGQHRLFAFTKAKSKNMELNCSVYLDLIPSLQASVFATVNFNQAPVDKSVAYNLFGYQLDKLEPKYWSPDLLAVNLCRYFAEKESSLFYHHINYRLATRNVPKGNWVISTASFVDGVLSLISKNPKEDRYQINKKGLLSLAGRKSLAKNSEFSLRDLFIDGNDEAIKQVIDAYFSSVKLIFAIEDNDNSVLTKTIGIKALFLLLNEILTMNEINKELLGNFSSMLEKAKALPFENTDFFSSSTKGQTRLLNCMRNKVLGVSIETIFQKSKSGVPDDYYEILK